MMEGGHNFAFQSSGLNGPFKDACAMQDNFGQHRDSDTHTDDGFGDSFTDEMSQPSRSLPPTEVMQTMQTWGTSDEHPARRMQQMHPEMGLYFSPSCSLGSSSRQVSGGSLRTEWGSEEWDDAFSVSPKTYGKIGAIWTPYPPGAFMVPADTGAPDQNLVKRADTGATPDENSNVAANNRQKNAMANTRQRGSRVDPMSWDEGVTTVMVRQIPRKYPQWLLVEEVNRRGFAGLFDFIYLPFDFKKGANVGYGFLNFIDTKYARAFRDTFDGNYLEPNPTNKGKPLHVHPASVQGYDANYQHFAQTKTGQKQDPQFSPLFFPHLSKKREAPSVENPPQAMQPAPAKPLPAQFSGQPINQTDMAQLATAQLILQGQMMAAVPGSNMAVPVAMMQVPQIQDFGIGAPGSSQQGGGGGFCPSCGAKHLAEHNFCSFCGFRLGN